MKTIKKPKKSIDLLSKSLSFSALFIGLLILFSCAGNREEKARMEKLNEVKKSVTKDLEEINQDIMDRIAYLDTEIENATGELKEKLEEARGMLIEQQNRVVKQIDEIKDCCIDEWDTRIKQTSEAVKEIRTKTNETSRKVRELLDD